jgi:response regulator RpfG family c-di-GMP phosphodiesterase
MNGFELARKVKQIKPQLKTILITAFEINPITLQKLKDESEVDHLIYKPVSPLRIIELLRT